MCIQVSEESYLITYAMWKGSFDLIMNTQGCRNLYHCKVLISHAVMSVHCVSLCYLFFNCQLEQHGVHIRVGRFPLPGDLLTAEGWGWQVWEHVWEWWLCTMLVKDGLANLSLSFFECVHVWLINSCFCIAELLRESIFSRDRFQPMWDLHVQWQRLCFSCCFIHLAYLLSLCLFHHLLI